MKKPTPQQMADAQQAIDAVAKHGSKAAAARIIDIPITTLKMRVDIADRHGLTPRVDVDAELAVQVRAKDGEIKELKRRLAAAEADRLDEQEVEKKIFGLARADLEPPRWMIDVRRGKSGSGVPSTLWSDWHWGEIVRPSEINNLNEYNMEIGETRFRRCVERTIDLAKNHMTNADWLINRIVFSHLKADKRFSWNLPTSGDAHYRVFNHRYFLTHGDALGVKGGDGIIGALGPIIRGAIKTGNSESSVGLGYDTLLIGHWHQYIPLKHVIVNNCGKGYDDYARYQLRAPFSLPSQALWFTHPKWGITANWEVMLESPVAAKEAAPWVSAFAEAA